MNLKKKGKSVNHTFHAAAILPTAVLSIGLTVPAPAAHATIAQPEEIVVTARRTEEVIQNVPISMTVFNQDMLNERNVTNGADLVNYTPSLSVNTRFGSDQATFAIRGFTQELRTTASVAVYFADVVAPRGGGSITAGDGAGPGSFFDLQNVQVLKGPQGTLFGRNTTGGAIQLIPQEPTSKLEGYLEESIGNYNMRRTQGVINVPINDIARARFGLDTQKRDGYIINESGIGPNHFNNVNYVSGRGSLILDLPNNIQNYTIASYTHSHNNGAVQGLFVCAPAAEAVGCSNTLHNVQHDKFYAVASTDQVDPISKMTQYQVINTTTWNASDNFTVKNNLSYANLNQLTRGSIFGSNFVYNGTPLLFTPAGAYGDLPSNAQKTFVEELQFSGTALETKLTWQGGLYFEDSKPDGWAGALSPAFINCQPFSSPDPATFNCYAPLAPVEGVVQANLNQIEYKNEAIYSQGTYDISDEFRVTAGLRYTVDKTSAAGYEQAWLGSLFANPAGGPPSSLAGACVISGLTPPDCNQHLKQKSEAPTWLIDFDYLPTPDMMVYAKYARGYRQGAININAPEGYQTFKPEKVDAYEIGTKTSFHGPISGTFNVAAFYNELSDQQIQVAYNSTVASPTTAIFNAGSSTIEGVEVNSTFKLIEDLTMSLDYTFLHTRLNSLNVPSVAPNGYQPVAAAGEGGPLSFSPRHTGTLSLSYRLPVPVEIGDISMGASYSYTGPQIATIGTYGELEQRKLVNLNLGWKSIMGSTFDASAFVTNLTQQKYTQYVAGLYDQFGADFRNVGEPRMVGVRVKYNFGK